MTMVMGHVHLGREEAVREGPTKEVPLKLSSETTKRANLAMNWEARLPGSHRQRP